MASVREELEKKFKLKQKKGQSAAEYRRHVIDTADGAADDVWETLTDPTQEWVNEGVDAKNAGTVIPDFPGEDTTDDEAGDGGSAKEEAMAKDSKKSKKGKAAAAAEPETEEVDEQEQEQEQVAAAPKATKGKGKKAAAAANGSAKSAKGKKNGASEGRPRISDDAVIHKKTTKLPDGNRNQYWDEVKEGASIGTIRKNKTLLRVVRYWRRKGFVEIRPA